MPAVPSQKEQPLSLKDCLNRARRFSYRIQQSRQRTKEAVGFYRQEKSLALPQFSTDVGRNQFFLAPYHFHQQWVLFTADWALGDWFLKTSEAVRNQAWAEKAKEEQTRLDIDRRVTLLYVGILEPFTKLVTSLISTCYRRAKIQIPSCLQLLYIQMVTRHVFSLSLVFCPKLAPQKGGGGQKILHFMRLTVL